MGHNLLDIRKHTVYLAIGLALLALSYQQVLIWMYNRFTNPDSYYSHGFLIPFICGYLIWQKRAELSQESWRFSPTGALLILAAIIIHLAGSVLYIFSLSGWSLYLMLIGSCLYLYGPVISRKIMFPLLFLSFMFPLPLVLINSISFPLKMLVAEIGVVIVKLWGLPVMREGFEITIPAGQLLVGNPCSGLRSLIAFLAIAALFAYIGNFTNAKRLILFFSAIPIAIASNIIRVPALILISHYYGLEAARPDAFWHTASGIIVFAIGLIIFGCLSRCLTCKTSPQDL